MYDGLGLTRFDAQKEEAVWKRVKKLKSSSRVRSTALVGDCLIASLATEAFRKNEKFKSHYVELIDIERETLTVPKKMQDLKLASSSIMKANADFKLFIFDSEANKIYVFDFV
jgi:hypothetical protein